MIARPTGNYSPFVHCWKKVKASRRWNCTTSCRKNWTPFSVRNSLCWPLKSSLRRKITPVLRRCCSRWRPMISTMRCRLASGRILSSPSRVSPLWRCCVPWLLRRRCWPPSRKNNRTATPPGKRSPPWPSSKPTRWWSTPMRTICKAGWICNACGLITVTIRTCWRQASKTGRRAIHRTRARRFCHRNWPTCRTSNRHRSIKSLCCCR